MTEPLPINPCLKSCPESCHRDEAYGFIDRRRSGSLDSPSSPLRNSNLWRSVSLLPRQCEVIKVLSAEWRHSDLGRFLSPSSFPDYRRGLRELRRNIIFEIFVRYDTMWNFRGFKLQFHPPLHSYALCSLACSRSCARTFHCRLCRTLLEVFY